ncbi:hypothetical protein C942_02704 [Photobacterium marinum]|uniref:Uncharacterized protein n=1 Tax=Photobacterium marinum TaxID=1056511 RepID=L8JEC0_9GAMM|nr:hypothetical protein [Photobacterium marinum]ELR67196.1 hypothetical protein C942_02704 [Photobacterium marinum]
MYTIPIMDNIRREYEEFQLRTIEFEHLGLYSNESELFAVVKYSNEAERELLERTYEEFRALASPPFSIVNCLDNSMKKVPLRTVNERIRQNGEGYTHNEAAQVLNLHIPKKYHPFHFDFKWGTNIFKLTVRRELSVDEKSEIQLICEAAGFEGYDYQFEVDSDIKDYPGVIDFKPNVSNNLILISSGLVSNQYSTIVLEQLEEDEDFWLTNRYKVFSGEIEGRSSLLPEGFRSSHQSCFVDASVFPRQNLRNYLTLYRQVIIALPMSGMSNSNSFFNSFQISKFEMQELISRGRLRFVVPQSIVRYDNQLMSDILSVDRNALIFSRRLAASTLNGIQKRTRFLGYSFSGDAQQEFIRPLVSSSNPTLRHLAKLVARQWADFEYVINREGATSVYKAGLAGFATLLASGDSARLAPEIHTAASSFEFSQGLGAHHVPFDSEKYSEINSCQLVTSLYNGVKPVSDGLMESQLETLLGAILAVNNDMSILSLDDELSEIHDDRIADIIARYSSLTSEELEKELYVINKQIRSIERSEDKLSRFDLKGFLPALVGAGAALGLFGPQGAVVGGLVPFGVWLLNYLCVNASSVSNSHIFTKLNSINHGASEDIVLLHNYQKTFKSLSN